MSIKVFYAWQSDRDGKICHHLIHDAAEAAIAAMNEQATVDEADRPDEVVLDHDTEGVAGTPRIADTIQQKIRDCDIFIGDVTHVADYDAHDGHGKPPRQKHAQNGNVLIELGMALAQKATTQIILVRNDAFGTGELPFDLRHHRRPISYTLADRSDKAKLDAAKKTLTKLLTDHLKASIEAVIKAKSDSDAAVVDVNVAKAEKVVGEFTRLVTAGRFKVVKNGPCVGLVIVPLQPPNDELDLDAIERTRDLMFWPIGLSWGERKLRGEMLVVDNSRKSQQTGQPIPASRHTELHESGVFLAIADVTTNKSDGEGSFCWFERVEREVIVSAAAYIEVLRKQNVKGPLMMSIVLTGFTGLRLFPSELHRWDTNGFSELTNDPIELGPITLPASDKTTAQAIAEAFRKPFTKVWRDAGIRYDPSFDEAGNWGGKVDRHV